MSSADARIALHLRRLRGSVAEAPADDDLTALDQLLDATGLHSVLRRDELMVRTERAVRAAGRA
ncbi:hypothetical protein C8250_000970 [Streptomyces sp. So13.3]|uniref:hypothetical protein n=1 Tax=Streptomyces TaxID=1883 RepID=UPI001105CD7C|nr:hypothetical protein C8250_000970 [Streptomyces sp. So13.3]